MSRSLLHVAPCHVSYRERPASSRMCERPPRPHVYLCQFTKLILRVRLPVQLARLRIQLQQQGIPLPEALQPRSSLESHPGVPGVMPEAPNAINTSGGSHASLPTSHISPR